MKSISAILLIGIYLLGMLRPIAPFIEYELNKDYISEFLCVNKDKQEEITICYGKCYLNKKIQEAQHNNSNKPIATVNFQEYPIGIIATSSMDHPDNTGQIQHTTIYRCFYRFLYSKGIDHPPTLS